MDSENKQRVSLYLDKQTVKTVDVFIKKHGLHSRNEFFERAAENLIADEAIKTGGDVMSEKLAKAVENVTVPIRGSARNADESHRKDKSFHR